MVREYNKESILDFGFYKGFQLGIVFICDPGWIDWSINHIPDFLITDLDDLIDAGVINGKLDWKYKGCADARFIPNINFAKTYQQALSKGVLDKTKYVFSPATIEKNANNAVGNRERTNSDDLDNNYNERGSTYENYNGSYAQDVEGWSDQDINDALDGEPDAYWNID